jgi:hypothetical protein
MRLFRQTRGGDWPEVVERVKAALEQRVRGDSTDVVPRAENPARTVPLLVKPTFARFSPGHKPGFSAVTETRVGIVQYFPDESLVGESISWYGEYLQPQLDLLGKLIGPAATLMEVGAGVGVHALGLAATITSAGHLFLYEPRPLMQRVLRQNLVANGVGNVTMMKRALGRGAEAGPIETQTESLDELHLERLHLLKINADASALEVLAGATDTLWRLRPLLCIAAPEDGALSELRTRTADFGYRCWRVETALFNPDNFNCREDDIFGGKVATALVAVPEETEIEVDFTLDGFAQL